MAEQKALSRLPRVNYVDTRKPVKNNDTNRRKLVRVGRDAWLTFKRYFPGLDHDTASYYMILVSTITLVLLGLVMVLSSSAVESIRQGNPSYGVFVKQAMWAIVGLIAMWVCSRTPKEIYKRLAWPAIFFAIFMLILVQLIGYEVNGNKNWINIGPFSGQPSELAKFTLALWLPMILSMKRKFLSDPHHVSLPVLPVSALIAFLVFIGHDMGTTIIILLIITGAIFIAGVPMRLMSRAIGAVMILAFLGVMASGNRIARIVSWFGSGGCTDTQGLCWQSQAGIYGLASGGWFGLGLGSSREKWSWLPEAHNDYIFAIVGEELGLVGTMTVLLLFCVLAFAFMRVVSRHADPYIRVATGAVMFWVMSQALINMGMVMGALPVIGVPLPLISAGGTALLFTLMGIGMVLSFARTEPKPGDEKNTRNVSYKGRAKPVKVQNKKLSVARSHKSAGHVSRMPQPRRRFPRDSS